MHDKIARYFRCQLPAGVFVVSIVRAVTVDSVEVGELGMDSLTRKVMRVLSFYVFFDTQNFLVQVEAALFLFGISTANNEHRDWYASMETSEPRAVYEFHAGLVIFTKGGA